MAKLMDKSIPVSINLYKLRLCVYKAIKMHVFRRGGVKLIDFIIILFCVTNIFRKIYRFFQGPRDGGSIFPRLITFSTLNYIFFTH